MVVLNDGGFTSEVNMQTTINTDYNIGDIVYTFGHYHEFCPINKPYRITNILVSGDINSVIITYVVEQDGISERIPQGWLFSTCAECTKYCEKLNKSL